MLPSVIFEESTTKLTTRNETAWTPLIFSDVSFAEYVMMNLLSTVSGDFGLGVTKSQNNAFAFLAVIE